MTRSCYALSSVLLFTLVACGGKLTDRKVVILQTTDEHSALLAIGPEVDDYPPSTAPGDGKLVGGIGRRSTLLNRERAQAAKDGATTFTFSSGDNFTGTLFQAAGLTVAPDLRSLKAMGYDATTLGNHEFDNGPAYLAGMIATAHAKHGLPQIVASNMVLSAASPSDDDGLKALTAAKAIQPSLVISRDGLKVGVLGVLGKTAAGDAPLKAPVSFLQDAALYAQLQAAVKDLRDKEQVDLVVVLAHAGTDPSSPTAGDSPQIALNVPGIDVVLSGHTHTFTAPYTVTNPTTGKPVVIVEPAWDGSRVARLNLTLKKDHSVVLDTTQSQLLVVDSTLPADPAMQPLVDEAIRSLEGDLEWSGGSQSMLERTLSVLEGAPVTNDPAVLGDLYFHVLGRTTFDLPRVLRQESGCLRLAGDAFLATSNLMPAGKPGWMPEVGLTAFGIVHDGLRVGESGRITLADAFRTYSNGMGPDLAGHETPGFPLVRMALPLAELKMIFELTALTPDMDVNFADNFVLPSGASFSFDRTLPPMDLANPTDPTKGRVTRITLAAPAAPGTLMDPDVPGLVVFDTANPAWAPYGGWNPSNPYGYPLCAYVPVTVTTDMYMALMSTALGLPIFSPTQDPATIGDPAYALDTADLPGLILWREDGSTVKPFEAYAAYVASICAGNGGYLPARYADPTATRVVQQ